MRGERRAVWFELETHSRPPPLKKKKRLCIYCCDWSCSGENVVKHVVKRVFISQAYDQSCFLRTPFSLYVCLCLN